MADLTNGMMRETIPAQTGFRARAFDDAGRHTARVRKLRRAIIGLSVGAVVGVIGYVVIDPFRRASGPFSVDNIGVEGTRVTMEAPRMNGYRKDGRPYDMRAAKGIQDVRKPTLIDLVDVDAKIAMADNSTAKITSLTGLYDTAKETITLRGNVRIRNVPAYDMHLTVADIDFKSGRLISKEPVNVLLAEGTIASDEFEMTDNGHQLIFTGNVKSLLQPGAAPKRKPEKGQKP
jgi:lipopolysaccharide export system protein LptC